jgi:hypothetical protein
MIGSKAALSSSPTYRIRHIQFMYCVTDIGKNMYYVTDIGKNMYCVTDIGNNMYCVTDIGKHMYCVTVFLI